MQDGVVKLNGTWFPLLTSDKAVFAEPARPKGTTGLHPPKRSLRRHRPIQSRLLLNHQKTFSSTGQDPLQINLFKLQRQRHLQRYLL